MRSTPSIAGPNELETTAAEQPESRECSNCRRLLPLTEFRWNRRRLNQRHAQCKDCRRIADRLRSAERAGVDVRRFLATLHRARTVNEVASALRLAIDRFGGVAAFSKAWWHAFETASPASSFCSRSLLALLQLNSQLASVKHTLSELHQMLDAELADQDYNFDAMSDKELQQAIIDLTEQRRQQTWLFIKYLQRLHEESCLVPTLTAMLDCRRLILSREERDALAQSLRFAVP